MSELKITTEIALQPEIEAAITAVVARHPDRRGIPAELIVVWAARDKANAAIMSFYRASYDSDHAFLVARNSAYIDAYRGELARIEGAIAIGLKFKAKEDGTYTLIAVENRVRGWERIIEDSFPGPDGTVVDRGTARAVELGYDVVATTFDISSTL
jgi:hypothetical protein